MVFAESDHEFEYLESMKRVFRYFTIVMISVAAVAACGHKEEIPNEEPTPSGPVIVKPSDEISQADYFAQYALTVYYLWNREIANDLDRLSPDTCKAPIDVVHDIRYHQGTKEVDHWTMLTNNLGEMTSSVEGTAKSFGYDLTGMWADRDQTALVFIVNYVSKGKPAEKAGLKRGDIIWTLNGSDITLKNYMDLFNASSVKLGVQPGISAKDLITVSMTANEDWEDPVLLSKTFDIDGKKVGYLVYNSFDIKSMETLPDFFRKFKADGVKELILDLRYNGGGFVKTECELASLIAPYANVAAKDVYQTEVFNSILTEAWKDDDFNTYFDTKFEHKNEDYDISEDISDANLDLKKLYVIVTNGSASASEGLIVGLKPYMDVVLIGEQTYGKYCAGYMMSPANVFGSQSTTDYSLIKKWGIYVMVSIFADKNKNNPAMPDGIPVNIKVEDDVLDGYQFGDEEETMLKAALTAAGKTYPKASSSSVRTRSETMVPVSKPVLKTAHPKGILIKTDLPSKTLPVVSE